MKKIIKILYISDDFRSTIINGSWELYKNILHDGIYYYSEEDNKFLFDADLVETIKEGLKVSRTIDYDIVLVDYGLVGNERKEFGELIDKEFVVLTGALDRHYIMNDLKKSPYDYQEFEIVRYNVDELKGDLYDLFKRRKNE